MIKDLKFALKCIKFAYNKKLYLSLFVIFLLLGTINFSTGHLTSYISGGFLLAIAPCLLCQLFQNVNMSNLVLSSPKKKRMAIQIVTIVNLVCILIGFAFFTIALVIVYSIGRCPAENVGFLYAVIGIFDLLMLIYFAFSYKYYIVSSVIFLVAFFSFYVLSLSVTDMELLTITISTFSGIGICSACILLGITAFYLISACIYKRPMDKLAMQSQLRREL